MYSNNALAILQGSMPFAAEVTHDTSWLFKGNPVWPTSQCLQWQQQVWAIPTNLGVAVTIAIPQLSPNTKQSSVFRDRGTQAMRTWVEEGKQAPMNNTMQHFDNSKPNPLPFNYKEAPAWPFLSWTQRQLIRKKLALWRPRACRIQYIGGITLCLLLLSHTLAFLQLCRRRQAGVENGRRKRGGKKERPNKKKLLHKS